MASLAGKVVIVTGASSGIGHALCLSLAQKKARLVLAARDEGRLRALAALCESRGGEALVAPADVTSEDACRALVQKSLERFGAIDVLVNNAGVGMIARFESISDLSVFSQLMQVNYLGSVYPTYFALPELRRSRGLLVAVSSLAGLSGVPTRTAYSASKHAVFGFFDSLRIELQGSGVDVCIVAPDFVVSEIHVRALGADGKPLGVSPMRGKGFLTSEECAAMIVTAMEQRQRLLITSLRGRVGRFLKLVAPGLIDSIALRAVERQ